MTWHPDVGQLAELQIHRLGHVPGQLHLVVEVVVVVWLSRKNASTCAEHVPNLTGFSTRRSAARSARSSRTRAGSSGRARPCRRRVASATSCRSSRASSRPGMTGGASACSGSAAPRARGPSTVAAGSGATSGRLRPRRGGSRLWSGCPVRPAPGRRRRSRARRRTAPGTRIHHRCVERPPPHVLRVPARAGPGAGHGRWKHQILRRGERHRGSALLVSSERNVDPTPDWTLAFRRLPWSPRSLRRRRSPPP